MDAPKHQPARRTAVTQIKALRLWDSRPEYPLPWRYSICKRSGSPGKRVARKSRSPAMVNRASSRSWLKSSCPPASRQPFHAREYRRGAQSYRRTNKGSGPNRPDHRYDCGAEADRQRLSPPVLQPLRPGSPPPVQGPAVSGRQIVRTERADTADPVILLNHLAKPASGRNHFR